MREELEIQKNGQRSAGKHEPKPGNGAVYGGGCGREVSWKDMSPVKMPVDFDVNPASTKDVPMVSQERHARSWTSVFSKRLNRLPKMNLW